MTDAQARRKVAHLDTLPDGDVTCVELEDREIALYRIDARVYATDNICTHGAARLCDGFLQGHTIECPLHQGTFDIRTGHATREPAEEPLMTYAVEVDDAGDIYLLLTA